MLRNAAGIFCALLIVSAALVHGAATHRWNALKPDPARAEWAHAHALSPGEYDIKDVPSELPVYEHSRVTCRQYTALSGDLTAVISLTSGPAGAVSTHTPDICYPSSGFKTVKAPKRETVELANGTSATYWVAEFEKSNATKYERHRIRWSWSDDGIWSVPDHHRVAFLLKPELFKIYIVTAVASESAESDRGDTPAQKAFVKKALQEYGEKLSAK